jgi:SOS-response transcriptional repressor LexA
MTDVTDRQFEVLTFMRRYLADNRMPPTVREICVEFGWASGNAALEHLKALLRKGEVTHRPGIARGWIPT